MKEIPLGNGLNAKPRSMGKQVAYCTGLTNSRVTKRRVEP